jgi:osmotically inducible protein OsmC
MERTGTAVWRGAGQDGSGALTTQSGALKDQPYSFGSRFVAEDGKPGTNPEELIAAAHAGCFSMALAFMLTGAGHAPEELRTTAHVKIERVNEEWTVTGVRLETVGKVPGIAPAAFAETAQKAKAECPISRLLANVPIELDAKLGA